MIKGPFKDNSVWSKEVDEWHWGYVPDGGVDGGVDDDADAGDVEAVDADAGRPFGPAVPVAEIVGSVTERRLQQNAHVHVVGPAPLRRCHLRHAHRLHGHAQSVCGSLELDQSLAIRSVPCSQ